MSAFTFKPKEYNKAEKHCLDRFNQAIEELYGEYPASMIAWALHMTDTQFWRDEIRLWREVEKELDGPQNRITSGARHKP